MRNRVQAGIQWAFMLLGMLAPVIFILKFPTTYYIADLGDFWNWSQYLKENIRDIYIQCTSCAYPLLGTTLTAGFISQLGVKEFSQIILPFRLYLAVFDIANVYLVYQILKNLEIKYAPFWAGVIGFLPSSWMGSSVWGQIEGFGQLLLLSMYLNLLFFNRKKYTEKYSYELFLVITGCIFALMILTKQLILFSMFSASVAVFVTIVLFSKNIIHFLRSIVILLVSFLTPLFIIDVALIDKKNYFSHLQYTLIKGSSLANIISGNGFNVWAFLAKSPIQSSHLPIKIQVLSLPVISITPYTAGIILFLSINVVLLYWYFRYYYRTHLLKKEKFLNNKDFFLFFLHIALVNLILNLVLTGTHERYLYHFYPFVIIAALGLFSRKVVLFLFIGGTSYAFFVLAHIKGLLSLYGQFPFILMFSIHFLLFCYLMYELTQKLKLRHEN